MAAARPLPLLAVLLLAGCGAAVQHGLEERDANEVVAALVAHGFRAAKVPEKGRRPTWAVEVDEGQATLALQLLTELRLPRPRRATSRGAGQGPGLIETPAAERLRQLGAQAGELEQTLETLGGVVQASVELAVPLASGRPGQAPPASKAAVLLKVRPEALAHLGQARGELQALVAGGVEGLRPEEVVLVLDPVELTLPAPAAAAAGPRPLVVALAVGVALLTAVVAALGWSLLRGGRRRPPPAPAPPGASPPGAALASPPRVSPAVQRKVA